MIDRGWPAVPKLPRILSICSSEIDFSLQRIGTFSTGLRSNTSLLVACGDFIPLVPPEPGSDL